MTLQRSGSLWTGSFGDRRTMYRIKTKALRDDLTEHTDWLELEYLAAQQLEERLDNTNQVAIILYEHKYGPWLRTEWVFTYYSDV
jgi:hypothetical protein